DRTAAEAVAEGHRGTARLHHRPDDVALVVQRCGCQRKEASGYGDRFHKMLYHAIHVDNEDLSKGFDLVTWLSARGVNQTLFESDTHSPFVEKHLKKAAQLARRYSVLELPTLVVDNRYVTNLGFAGSPDRLYVILDKLLIKAKADRKAGH
ncbi:MAG: DsbA family protein, partial [Pseudomonadota bacterium]|nr:DsbA family protein [Pseudomonadota bacterium]